MNDLNRIRKLAGLNENTKSLKQDIIDLISNDVMQALQNNLPDSKIRLGFAWVRGQSDVRLFKTKDPSVIRAKFILGFSGPTSRDRDDAAGNVMKKRDIPHLSFEEMINVVKTAELPGNVSVRNVAPSDSQSDWDDEKFSHNPNPKNIEVVLDVKV